MPLVRGTSRTDRDEVSVYCEVRDGGRSQDLGILACTDERFEAARVRQSGMGGAVVMVVVVVVVVVMDGLGLDGRYTELLQV
jgi:hypothetical protein